MTAINNGRFALSDEQLAGCAQPVLNPYLYQKLQERFGDVLVAKQGEPSLGRYLNDGSGTKYAFDHAGEYYRVNCPFCAQRRAVDTKKRLWIHHRWGVGLDKEDPERRAYDKFWWTTICYNEGCMSRIENVHTLRNWIYTAVGREGHAPEVKILPASPENISLGIVDWPGDCLRVDRLPDYHPACQYLKGRGFDPAILGPQYNLSFCTKMDSRYPMADQKIIIPIYMNGKFVSWQARAPYDIDWKQAGQPKYYNAPGTNNRLVLYDFDNAQTSSFVTIVEGASDCWKHGSGVVALLGKSMSMQQANMILATWKAAVLVLDAEAQEEAHKMQTKLHAIPTVVVALPAGVDPATADSTYFWDLICASADAQGVNLIEP
jgi:hypothetical protein